MERRGVAEGMMVRDSGGKKLGSVIECGADRFLVEKGLFFPKDYAISYDEVESVGDGEIRVRFAAGELEERGRRGTRETEEGSIAATHPVVGAAAGAGGTGVAAMGGDAGPAAMGEGTRPAIGATGDAPEAFGAPSAREAETREEVRVPLASEEIEAGKREREAGEVRVTKEVVTEQKQVTVPTAHEEVHVERVPVEGSPAAGEGAFQEKTVSVPVHEEEVEIRKRPLVREEVRVGKVRREGEQRAEAEVRREEARIEREGDRPEGDVNRGEPDRE